MSKRSVHQNFPNAFYCKTSDPGTRALDRMVGDYQFTCPVTDFAQRLAETNPDQRFASVFIPVNLPLLHGTLSLKVGCNIFLAEFQTICTLLPEFI